MPEVDSVIRKVLVSGASGYIGGHLALCMAKLGSDVLGIGRSRPVELPRITGTRIDLADLGQVRQLLSDFRPTVIFHCAAEANAGKAEVHQAQAEADIIHATRNLCDVVQETFPATPVVMLSTDLVFDGKSAPYAELDPPNPLSHYGQCKVAAEKLVQSLAKGLVVRTSLVYGPPLPNSPGPMAWMVKGLRRQDPLTLFVDEVRTPIYVNDLCRALAELVIRGESGIWHAGGIESMSRLEMGKVLCKALDASQELLEPAMLKDSDYPAPRPANVSLDSSKLWKTLHWSPVCYPDAVKEMISQGKWNGC